MIRFDSICATILFSLLVNLDSVFLLLLHQENLLTNNISELITEKSLTFNFTLKKTVGCFIIYKINFENLEKEREREGESHKSIATLTEVFFYKYIRCIIRKYLKYQQRCNETQLFIIINNNIIIIIKFESNEKMHRKLQNNLLQMYT